MISKAQPPPRGGPPPSVGQMTAVMRAVTRPTAPRVLRAALVRGGKVVDERVLPRDAPLTVGPSERNTFVIAELPASVRLIEPTPEGYQVRAAPGVGGRVAKGAAIHDLQTIGGGALVIGDDARGKLTVGGSIVLFHFVDPPVRAPRAQLPLSVQKGALGDLDWRTTCIAAFSFLFHFGAVGAVYSDWADPVTDDDGYLVRTVQILKEITSLPPIEQIVPASDEPSKSADAAPTAAPAAAGRGTAPGPVARGGPAGGGRMTESRAHDIAAQLAASDDAMLQVLAARGGAATDRVMSAGADAPLGMLEKIAAGAGGARPGDPADLKLGGNGGVVRPGQVRRAGLAGDGDGHADSRSGDVGKQAEVKKPIPSASIPPPSVMGNVPDAPRVVAGLKGALKACYKHALDEDPTMRGSVRVTASIAPNGEVKSAQAAGSGLSSSMISCVTRVVRSAPFSPPDGGGATIVIPMTFLPQ